MGLAKAGKDRTLLVLAEQPDERAVLPQLHSLARRRGGGVLPPQTPGRTAHGSLWGGCALGAGRSCARRD